MSEDHTVHIRSRLDYSRELVLDVPTGVYHICKVLAEELPSRATAPAFVSAAQGIFDRITTDITEGRDLSEVDGDTSDLVLRMRSEWEESFPAIVNAVCPPRYAKFVLAYHSARKR